MAKRRTSPAARQRMVAAQIDPRTGLGGMLAREGASKDVVKAAREIEATPGGPELLYTFAVQDFMKKMGAPNKDVQKIRLYEMGGYVDKAEGGLASAAETTRKGGRGGDSMLVHMTPEEFDVIKTMWGEPDINPDTGMPEYGFLSKIWKKVKKAVKKVFSSKIFQVVAPIALSIFAPGLGTAIGSALTGGALGATGSAIVGNALVRGTMSSLGGGDFAKGAIQGAISGGLGQVAGDQISKVAGDAISGRTADIVGGALVGGAGAELTGGDFASGAVMGGLGEYMRPTMEGLAERGQQKLGLMGPEEGGILARRIPTEYGTPPAGQTLTAEQLAMGPPAPGPGEPGSPYAGPPTPAQQAAAEAAAVAAPAAPTPAAPSPTAGGAGLGLGDLAVPALLMSGMGGGEYEEGARPELPPHMMESLPVYTSTRSFVGPTDPNLYYTYGQAGAPTTGESLFITPDPFSGEAGTPTIGPAGGLGQAAPPRGRFGRGPAGGRGALGGVDAMIASGAVVPSNMARYGGRSKLLAAGYTQDPNTGDYYPPEATLGQGTGFAGGGYQRGGEFDYWAQNADVQRASPTVSAAGRYVKGPGTGRSDDIPARLSDGEYVIDAETVALLGDGSGDAGAKRLDEMRRNLRKHKATNLKKGEFTHKARSPDRYMPRLRAAAGRA